MIEYLSVKLLKKLGMIYKLIMKELVMWKKQE